MSTLPQFLSQSRDYFDLDGQPAFANEPIETLGMPLLIGLFSLCAVMALFQA